MSIRIESSPEMLLSFNDLSEEFKEKIVGHWVEVLKNNSIVVDTIAEEWEQDNSDGVEGRLGKTDFIELRVSELAQEASQSFRQFVLFETEVEL